MNLIEAIQNRIFGEDDEPAEDLTLAHSTLAVASGEWYKAFMEWIAKETDKPFTIAASTDMIVAGTRANTLREVRDRIQSDIRRAEQAIARARERD